MTFLEINELQIEDVLYQLLDRLLDLSLVPSGDLPYTIDEDESIIFYDRIAVHESLIKPSKTKINNELGRYKAALIIIEQARLDEIARREALSQRLDSLKDARMAVYKAGLDIPNLALEFVRIINDNDETRLQLLEEKDAEFQLEQDSKAYIEKRKAEYPSIEALVVAMWEGDQSKIDELEAIRQAVKEKYPKSQL